MMIKIQKMNPDIIGLTEVKPKNSRFRLQNAELNINGYTCFHNIETNGRGVALYVKTHLNAFETNFSDKAFFSDSVWCQINLINDDKLLIGCVYRSPSSSSENNKNLSNLLERCNNTGFSHLVIMGDFNFPEICWKNECSNAGPNHPATLFLETVRENYLYQHVVEPTHFRGDQNPNILDLIFTNEENVFENIEVDAPVGKSHHAVLTFQINCYCENIQYEKEILLLNKGRYGDLNNELANIDWDQKLMDKNVEQQWGTFEDIIVDCITKHVPKRKIHASKKRNQLVDGVTLNIIKTKKEAFKNYLSTRNEAHYREYCKLRNKTRRATRLAAKNYEKMIARETKGNSKAFYRYVNSKTKIRQSIPDLELENSIAKTDTEKATVLNNFFASTFTREDSSSVLHSLTNLNVPPLDSIEIVQSDVYKKLKYLKIDKAQGYDGIPPRILKETAEIIAYPLTKIFIESINSGILPSKWKKANITPIFKKGDKKKAENYRPISLTSVCCKLLESLIKQKILSHMHSNNLLYKDQHGFIKGRSCMTQMLSNIESWTEALDKHHSVDTIYFDFKKAFDTVPHEKLKAKLKYYCITGKVYDWISSFISDRAQRVMINGQYSNWTEVISGVPQGSVLGPVLFLIYINDLPNEIESQIKLYADDTKLIKDIKGPQDNTTLQSDINKLVHWSEKWQLAFHPEKCNYLTMGNGQITNYYISYSGKETIYLSNTHLEKDLGITVDQNLSFRSHICDAVKKANQTMGMIRRTFKYLDKEMFCLLFKSKVRPILEYGNIIWKPRHKIDCIDIENVQRRATKMIPGLSKLSYPERLKVLDLPSLQHRQLRGDMIETFKILNNYYDFHFPFLNIDNSSTRGHPFKLIKTSL